MYETEFPFIPNARTAADRELTESYQAAAAFMQTALPQTAGSQISRRDSNIHGYGA